MSVITWHQFERRREGMAHALDGGLWLHLHEFRGERMAHLVSSDRELLLGAGRRLEMRPQWLQYKPLKRVDSGQRVEAWHWDLRGRSLELGIRLAGPKIGRQILQAPASDSGSGS